MRRLVTYYFIDIYSFAMTVSAGLSVLTVRVITLPNGSFSWPEGPRLAPKYPRLRATRPGRVGGVVPTI